MRCDSEFLDIVFKNAVIFLDEAVGFINSGLNERKNLVLAIVNMQFAIELSLKSFIVNYYGIRKVLIDKQADMTDVEIDKLFNENELKAREFDSLKNFTKSIKTEVKPYNFDKSQYKHMEQLQNLRNKILHSSYVFSEEECLEMEHNLIYVLVHILGSLMSDRMDYEYRKFVQEYLSHREYSKLLQNLVYNSELIKFLNNEYDKLYTCPHCYTKTVTPYRYCARCLTDFDISNQIYAFVKCGWCGEDMVICDSANIESNNNMIRGLCLNCDEDTTVYKCPKCKKFVNAELFDKKNCHIDYCSFFDDISSTTTS